MSIVDCFGRPPQREGRATFDRPMARRRFNQSLGLVASTLLLAARATGDPPAVWSQRRAG